MGDLVPRLLEAYTPLNSILPRDPQSTALRKGIIPATTQATPSPATISRCHRLTLPHVKTPESQVAYRNFNSFSPSPWGSGERRGKFSSRVTGDAPKERREVSGPKK